MSRVIEQFDLTKHIQEKIDKVMEIGRKMGMSDKEIDRTIAIGLNNTARGMFCNHNR